LAVLTKEELDYLRKKLKRNPGKLEQDIVGAEWSEHCSYKSSRIFIKKLPNTGKRTILGLGDDAGVLQVGDGHVITVHIESHNHPSAVEPYGGAATGVGGVIRDIMTSGTRPICLLNALRFGPIYSRAKNNNKDNDKYSHKSKWLFKNVVRGIADYGNCIGVPTVAGEVEFDKSFEDYCLVDVASIGIGRQDRILINKAEVGDRIILAGGTTGRDGMHGAVFASKTFNEEDRSAIQIPDPFLEKLLLEATIEALDENCIKTMKDLGGGGLSCCLSELSDSLKRGFDVELTNIHVRQQGMSPAELMISESQERMLYIVGKSKIEKIRSIFDKYGIKNSIIGTVKPHQDLVIRYGGKAVAHMPSNLVAHAPLAYRGSKYPEYLKVLNKSFKPPKKISTFQSNNYLLNRILLCMLSNPSIASKRWIYEQYDHEVGIRTIIKPGCADASVLKLDNGKFLSMKLDGNSKMCYLDPYHGTLGILSESCRNIICTGAEPIGVMDHLQFGSPEDSGIFWTFIKTVDAITDYCKFMEIPVVAGKVSFYNETPRGPIKPSPVIGALGLIDNESFITQSTLKAGNSIFIIGSTKDEMGGSEYYEYYHHITGGTVPKLDFEIDRRISNAILQLIRNHLVDCVHDCSKGGLAIALCEMAIHGNIGFTINLGLIPNSCSRIDNLLFSESHSRYIVGTREPQKVQNLLSGIDGIIFSRIGHANRPSNKNCIFVNNKSQDPLINISVQKLAESFHVLDQIID
jgi:phosphoribosylformylglycinamidine synthase